MKKMINNKELCEAEVRKNLVLVELGEPLTLSLRTLNKSCEFRKKWNECQNKWHGPTKEQLIAKQKQKEYNQRPEVKQKQKEYNQRPEVKQKQKEYKKEYYKNNK